MAADDAGLDSRTAAAARPRGRRDLATGFGSCQVAICRGPTSTIAAASWLLVVRLRVSGTEPITGRLQSTWQPPGSSRRLTSVGPGCGLVTRCVHAGDPSPFAQTLTGQRSGMMEAVADDINWNAVPVTRSWPRPFGRYGRSGRAWAAAEAADRETRDVNAS